LATGAFRDKAAINVTNRARATGAPFRGRDMAALIEGRAALVVIDVQQGGYLSFEEAGIPLMPGFAELVERVVRVVEASRAAGVPVVFTQEVHRRDLVDFGRELDGDEGVHCLEGDPGTELVEELRPREGDYLIAKRRYSCFFGTELEILLRGLDVQTLLLVGGLTDVCVHYTFADAHQWDYHVRVLEDCVLGSTVERHNASLSAMEYLQHGARRTSQEVLAALGSVPQPAGNQAR
jgi:nicotinamidase-related amidase